MAKGFFLAFIPELLQKSMEQHVEGVQLFEGTVQLGLIVEEFYAKDMEHYNKIKAERLNEDSPFWKNFHNCIQGGVQTLHIWAFKKVD